MPDNDRAIALRPVLPDDEGFLLSVYASTRSAEVAMWGWAAAQQELFLKMQFKAQSQSYQAQFPQAEHQIILCDGEPAGRLMVNRSDEAILLVDIALLPPFQNRGIGTTLMRQLFKESAETRKPVRLQVLKFNQHAERLYTRLGFAQTGDNGMYLDMERAPGD